MEVYQPMKLNCSIGGTEATLFVPDGKISHDARAYVENVCEGCKRWSRETIQTLDAELSEELGSEYVNPERVELLRQQLINPRKSVPDDLRPIIISMCNPIGA